MDNITEYLGLIIFIAIGILSSYYEQKKKREQQKNQNKKIDPQNSQKPVKNKTILDRIEEELFTDPRKVETSLEINPYFKEKVYTELQKKDSEKPAYKQVIPSSQPIGLRTKAEYNYAAVNIKKKINSAAKLKELILIQEILGKPKALKD